MNKPLWGEGAQLEGRQSFISLSWIPRGHGHMRGPATAPLPTSPAEFVNMREPSMDMKSVTDRAAQTLLWTELIRGGPWGKGSGRLGVGTDC